MKSIIFGDLPVGFWDSIYISVVSMIVVFFVLVLIANIISLLKFIHAEEKNEKNKKKRIENSQLKEQIKDFSQFNSKRVSEEDIKDEKMLAALSVALIEAAGETSDSHIRVKNIRELN